MPIALDEPIGHVADQRNLLQVAKVIELRIERLFGAQRAQPTPPEIESRRRVAIQRIRSPGRVERRADGDYLVQVVEGFLAMAERKAQRKVAPHGGAEDVEGLLLGQPGHLLRGRDDLLEQDAHEHAPVQRIGVDVELRPVVAQVEPEGGVAGIHQRLGNEQREVGVAAPFPAVHHHDQAAVCPGRRLAL